MVDVEAWLKGLGLEQYAEAFARNDVDGDTLSKLTAEDLTDIGVKSVGHRRRLLDAINQLDKAEPESIPSPETKAGLEGERRQVTVLFADIAGYTKISSELGAEKTHALLNRYFGTVDGIVESYGGSVDKHMGDNVMAVFGAPVAHTDDPERAIRAATDIHQAMTGLSDELGRDLKVHIGIASGQVVASGTGSDAHREYTVTGDTVNLASRLDDMAAAGETLISEAVRRAASHMAICSSYGQVSVKGFSRKIEVWAVQRLEAAPSSDHLTAFVGRRMELRQFAALLDEALEHGTGHSLLVRGEPGIGKTRLIEEFVRIAGDRGFAPHKALILDFGVGKGQDAIRALVRSVLAVSGESGESERQAAVQHARATNLISKDRIVFLNDLLDLSQPAGLSGLYDAMDSATRKEGARETVTELIRSEATRGPLLIVVEDLHWADEITLHHLTGIARIGAESPVLLMMTTRVEGLTLEQEWLASLRGCPLTTMELQPLRPEEALKLAKDLADSGFGALETFVERAEGNPFFLEQLMGSVSEASTHGLPDTLQGLVLARIDRLARKDRDAVRAASVLGQRFSLQALHHLLGEPGYDHAALLEHRLVRPEGSDYLFSHALVRDGIYASLLQGPRQDLHGLAADFYSDRDAVLHAEHLDRASSPGAPQAYLAAAQEQAGQIRYENGFRLVGRALEIVSAEESFALRLLEGELLRLLGSISASINAYQGALEVAADGLERCRARIGIAEGLRLSEQHSELLQTLDRAEDDAGERELFPERARIHQLRGNVYFTRGEIDACLQASKTSLKHARDGASPELEAQALGGMGEVEFAQGHMISAHDYFDQCIELSRTHNFARIVAANLSMRGQTFLYQNQLDAALDDCRAAAELARQIRQPRAEMIAAIVATYVLDLVDPTAGREWAKIGLDIARRLGSKLFEEINLEYLARFAAQDGDLSEAQKLMQEAIAILRETESGMRFEGARSLGSLALFTPDPDRRRAALDEGEELLRLGATGHNYLWFYRDAMEVCLQIDEWDAVERYAEALEDYTSAEPLPWSSFFIARGRMLAAFGRGRRDDEIRLELHRLRDQAVEAGLKNALPSLEDALAAP
jgi:class 3 adenylate cyclase/tetratricopeptide (TPR) repeat protein